MNTLKYIGETVPVMIEILVDDIRIIQDFHLPNLKTRTQIVDAKVLRSNGDMAHLVQYKNPVNGNMEKKWIFREIKPSNLN